ncbi:uncharacterized protein VTP21DRAFT_3525 [Calcarisporiella thermophila]|uniref:uncharacterized protein n=1 Tax=Calcarisporiella thermophila TaxID=911321 RepID=UPI003743BAD1
MTRKYLGLILLSTYYFGLSLAEFITASIGGVAIDFNPSNPYSPSISSYNTTIVFEKLNGNVTELSANTSILYQGREVGFFKFTDPAPKHIDNNKYTLRYSNIPIRISPEQRGDFASLIKSITQDAETTMSYSGFTEYSVDGVPADPAAYNITHTEKGFNSFKNIPFRVRKVNIKSGTPNALMIEMTGNMDNPTNWDIKLGDLSFSTYYRDTKIGNSTLYGLRLRSGINMIVGNLTMNSGVDAANSAGRLIRSYVEQREASVVSVGTEESTEFELLKPAIYGVKLEAIVPGASEKIILKGESKAALYGGIFGRTSSRVLINNIHEVPLNIKSIKGTILWQGKPFATVDVDIDLMVPGRSRVFSPYFKADLSANIFSMMKVLTGPRTITVDMSLESVKMVIGEGYKMDIGMRIRDIPMTINML